MNHMPNLRLFQSPLTGAVVRGVINLIENDKNIAFQSPLSGAVVRGFLIATSTWSLMEFQSPLSGAVVRGRRKYGQVRGSLVSVPSERGSGARLP